MLYFFSTRGQSPEVQAPEAILKGIAPDGGLYTISEIPQLDWKSMLNMNFLQVAETVLCAFLPGYTEEEIHTCVAQAYQDTFDVEEIVPVKKVGDQYVLELFHGPTAAFKDVALSILPRLMRTAMKKMGRQDELMILTATSGDTGSAALRGFRDVPGTSVMVFYPDQGISPIQRAQMTTMSGSNVCACAVEGNFDDAQSGVKSIFGTMPEDFCKANGFSLSSANSINFGRLAPQIVYYYTAYLALVAQGEVQPGQKVQFCVPTGNFGDILAGYFARESGLPIDRLICASNANRVLTDFFGSGLYNRNREFVTTLSPSMDILISSNLERLLLMALGDPALVKEKMEKLKETGFYAMPDNIMAKIRDVFSAEWVDDTQSLQTIGEVFRKTGYVMDPHTAVAWEASKRQQKEGVPCIVLSTASPYKFPASVLQGLEPEKQPPQDAQEQLLHLEELTGTRAPDSLRDVLSRPVRFEDVIAPAAMMDYVKGKAAKA